MIFRNLDVTPDDPVSRWGFEGVLTAFDLIYTELSGHTWYVQMALNRAVGMGKKITTEKDVREALDSAIESENATYKAYCKMLPRGQLAVLKALAAEREASNPLKSSFISKHALEAASSVRQALKALEDKALKNWEHRHLDCGKLRPTPSSKRGDRVSICLCLWPMVILCDLCVNLAFLAVKPFNANCRPSILSAFPICGLKVFTMSVPNGAKSLATLRA